MNKYQGVDRMLIGISGSTGSGKTVFANRLMAEIGVDDCLLIQQDSYFIDRSHLSREEAEKTNYDHPDSVDFRLLEDHLEALKSGKCARIPRYDYASHARTEAERETAPRRVIILEGILIFHSRKIREMLDLKIFLHADEDVRIARRIERDIKERGRTRSEVLIQYYDTVQPMDKQYIAPGMKWADIIVPHDTENPLSVTMIADYVRSRIRK